MKRFKKVYIEITNVCNLSCNFCPKTGRKLQFSDEEKFKEIIEKVKRYKTYMNLSGTSVKKIIDYYKIS